MSAVNAVSIDTQHKVSIAPVFTNEQSVEYSWADAKASLSAVGGWETPDASSTALGSFTFDAATGVAELVPGAAGTFVAHFKGSFKNEQGAMIELTGTLTATITAVDLVFKPVAISFVLTQQPK